MTEHSAATTTDAPDQTASSTPDDAASTEANGAHGAATKPSGDSNTDAPGGSGSTAEPTVVVVTQDGMGVVAEPPADGEPSPVAQVTDPSKAMRLGSMVKQLLEEVRDSEPDDAGRQRLADIHRRSIDELRGALSADLAAELDRIVLPLEGGVPTTSEVRIVHAQLVGWLEGVFHGIQTALVAQQVATKHKQPHGGPASITPPPSDHSPTGQYL